MSKRISVAEQTLKKQIDNIWIDIKFLQRQEEDLQLKIATMMKMQATLKSELDRLHVNRVSATPK